MPVLALIMALVLATSCGGFKFFDVAMAPKERTIASMPSSHLLSEDEEAFTAEIDEKLKNLNSYYLIAQKNLQLFDESISEKSLEELFESGPYLHMLATKTQVEEIEREITELFVASKISHLKKHQIIRSRIRLFSQKGKMKNLAVNNLSQKLKLESLPDVNADLKNIEDEYEELQSSKEFQIYEKNIEHLSHLLEMKIKSHHKRFKPASSTEGHVTGDEFPAKVWALTFDNGPEEEITESILKNLKAKKLKATFFQLSTKSQKHIQLGRMIRDAGMEIGSNSHSYKDLAKAGRITLEKEITEATESLEKALKVDVKFFRLPFGSGVTIPSVRQTISRNNLINVNWNIDSLDWMAQTPDKIVARTKRLMKKTTRDSGIILFHDIHGRSIEASAIIMDHLKVDGRRSCTIGKIVKDMNEGAETVCLKP